MRIFRKKSPRRRPELEQLLGQIQKTKLALDTAYSNFENVTEPELIDSCIYEVNAIHQRYKFLLQKAKEISGPEIIKN